MKPRILLINPPIYDFAAYDFWLKPYGMLRAAGFLRGQANFRLFDYLDRFHPGVPIGRYRADAWGRGEFYSEPVDKPDAVKTFEVLQIFRYSQTDDQLKRVLWKDFGK